MSIALLVVDVQQGLCHGPSHAFLAEEVIRRINIVSEKARAAGVLVVFIQHEAPSDLLEYGTPAWQLADGLHVTPDDLKMRKETPDSFHRTELEGILHRHKIAELVICGMHTEFCVDTTIRSALARGYPVTLIEDGHTTDEKMHLPAAQIIRHHNQTLVNITSFGPRVQTVTAEALRL